MKDLFPGPEKGNGLSVEPVQSGLLRDAPCPSKRRHAVPVASEAVSLIVCGVSTGPIVFMGPIDASQKLGDLDRGLVEVFISLNIPTTGWSWKRAK